MLTKELQSKLRTKTDELNEAIKRNSEVFCVQRSLMHDMLRPLTCFKVG